MSKLIPKPDGSENPNLCYFVFVRNKMIKIMKNSQQERSKKKKKWKLTSNKSDHVNVQI